MSIKKDFQYNNLDTIRRMMGKGVWHSDEKNGKYIYISLGLNWVNGWGIKHYHLSKSTAKRREAIMLSVVILACMAA